MTIFKQYDIRGRYPQEINKKTALKIIKALKAEKIVLGHDGQRDSKALTKDILECFDKKIQITNLGPVPTSLVPFAILKLKADAGLMITASHLPKNYAGFKIFNKNGLPIKPKVYLVALTGLEPVLPA